MRAVTHGDLIAVARVLLCVRAEDRMRFCADLFERAHIGDKIRKKLGRIERGYGDGSLGCLCYDLPQRPEPYISDTGFAECLHVVLCQVMRGHV